MRLRGEKDRHRISRRRRQRDLVARTLKVEGAAHSIVPAHKSFAGAEAARDAEMTLEELRLLRHVSVHVAPAIFLDDCVEVDCVEVIERDVVIR